MNEFSEQSTAEPTSEQIERAATRWSCHMVTRHMSRGDLAYFRQFWRTLPDLRTYIESELHLSRVVSG